MFDCCLVSSLSLMVFYNILLPMFSASRSPASLPLVCVPPRPTAAWLLLRSVVPYHSLFLLLLLRPSRQVRLLFLSTSLLSLGYPSPTPPSLFLTGYFDAQVSGFRYPSPAPPRLFWPPILTPRSPFSGTPGPSFRSLFWCPWSSVSTPSFFPTQPSLPGYLGGRLALCAALRFACDFYRSAVFTAPRFLPLRGFYRSAFTGFFGGSALPPPSCLLPPSLRPLPGAPCGAGSFVASPVGRHSWPSFCTACLTTLGALPLISPVPLLCNSYKLRDRRSSRLLSVGTRAPRVLPPPSGTSRRMEIRHFHHRLTEVPSVDMLIEAWNGSIYRWHGVSLWCGFLHIPQIHAPPVPETR